MASTRCKEFTAFIEAVGDLAEQAEMPLAQQIDVTEEATEIWKWREVTSATQAFEMACKAIEESR